MVRYSIASEGTADAEFSDGEGRKEGRKGHESLAWLLWAESAKWHGMLVKRNYPADHWNTQRWPSWYGPRADGVLAISAGDGQDLAMEKDERQDAKACTAVPPPNTVSEWQLREAQLLPIMGTTTGIGYEWPHTKRMRGFSFSIDIPMQVYVRIPLPPSLRSLAWLIAGALGL
ncbi:hypothetical protein BP5796_04806 [Coleophoma crateriformis]|uniref:Uncharacterized protein n=1 Tax=Coleophoma crateriformis TaxID=565419 RepID=A0A3D8SAG3_9HELO|nr:hypothetical protein BP5796_04806 [Coleophoma crateriformis]